jgi:hypothetical protein
MLNKDYYLLLSIQETLKKIIKYSSAYLNTVENDIPKLNEQIKPLIQSK